MSLVAVIMDTHVGVRNDNPAFHRNFEKSMRFFLDEIEKRDIQHVIHGGDLFDRRKYLNYVSANICRSSFLMPLDGMDINTYIIAGNHDQYYKNTYEVNALDEIVGDRYSSITCYNTAHTISIDDKDILLVPWINDANRQDTMDKIRDTKADVVVGHLEMTGFEMYKGIVMDHGDDPAIFKKFKLVLSGHYHHRSQIGNIQYMGAFGEYTWADYDDPRGFGILDTETLQLEFIRNPYPMFKVIHYDDKDNTNILEDIKKMDYTQYTDTYVKVICKERTNSYAFDLMMNSLSDAAPVDFSVVEDMSQIEDLNEDEEIDEAQDTVHILGRYIDGLTLPVDTSKMKTYMKEIYTQALTQEKD
jgi:DNA repair exonuclease SbcCD nuclease subunit